MVVLELALTLVLLVGAGLMVRSFLKLYTLDIGIKPDNLMAMDMRLPDRKYPTPDARRAFYERLAPKLAAIPGADSLSLTTSVPPFGAGRRSFDIEGRPVRKPEDPAPEAASYDQSAVLRDRRRAVAPWTRVHRQRRRTGR